MKTISSHTVFSAILDGHLSTCSVSVAPELCMREHMRLHVYVYVYVSMYTHMCRLAFPSITFHNK